MGAPSGRLKLPYRSSLTGVTSWGRVTGETDGERCGAIGCVFRGGASTFKWRSAQRATTNAGRG